MAEKQNTPEIRFEGFTDPWEQRKLGDLISVYIAHAGPEEDVTVLTSSRDGIQKQEDHFGRLQQHDTSDWNLIPYGYCTYRNRSDDGLFTFNVNKVADRGIVSKFYPVFETPECDADFLVAYLNSSQEIRKKLFVLAVGTSQVVLSYGALKELSLLLPQNREQSAIANVLNHIDNLITLHQRKYDKLCTVKKSMLDKMFPKPGETEPEIRFEGFTDPWEQRKLNEYLETSREKNESCRFDKDDVLSVSGDYGIVNQIEFQGRSYAGASVANYGVVHKGDVVYTKSPLRSNPYGIIKTNRGNDGIVSTLYAVYHPAERTHPDFVEVYFEQNARMNNYMAPLVSKGAKNDMKVSAENALKGAVIFPEIEEQEVIASYFSQLDHLITLHQRKLELLRNIKKSLLDRMFV